MPEPSIVNRLAKFVEQIQSTTGSLPKSIVITQAQLDELFLETDTKESIKQRRLSIERGEPQVYKFWGVPLIISEANNGPSTIQSH